jgi:hypothetical protein
MTSDKITTESVAVGAQETDPIVLRESETRRLVFKPMIVDKPEAPVRGYFVWQRKLKANEWEDITGETLTALKAGEGYALELRSDEVATLLREIEARKGIYEEHGIVFGRRDYFAETDLPEVVRKILQEPDSELAKALQALDPAELLSLGRSVDLSKLDALLEEWDASEETRKDDEDFWPDLLKRNGVGVLPAHRFSGRAPAGAGVRRREGDREHRRRIDRLPGAERAHGQRVFGRDQDTRRRAMRRRVPGRDLPAGQGGRRRGRANARLP